VFRLNVIIEVYILSMAQTHTQCLATKGDTQISCRTTHSISVSRVCTLLFITMLS